MRGLARRGDYVLCPDAEGLVHWTHISHVTAHADAWPFCHPKTKAIAWKTPLKEGRVPTCLWCALGPYDG